MKLYIPTCTINLNNIFSTGSISPPIFYEKRNFGIKRFKKVNDYNIENSIILYPSLFSYELDNDNYDNYPMVIEIDTNSFTPPLALLKSDSLNVYISNSTIYLDPEATSIYVKKSIIPILCSRAGESEENKFFSLYEKCFKGMPIYGVTTPHRDTKKISDTRNIHIEKEIEKDRTIDKIKGFAYCYLIGANLAVSKDIASLRLLEKKIKNTVATIVNSPDHKPTTLQKDKLHSEVSEFHNIFKKVDRISLQNQKKINQILKKISEDVNIPQKKILEILEYAKVKEEFIQKHQESKEYNVFDILYFLNSTSISSKEYSRVITDISDAVVGIEKDQVKRRIDVKELFIHDGKLHINDTTFDTKYYNKFINTLIMDEYDKESLPKDNLNLSVAIICGRIVKEQLAEQWEGSKEKVFINELLTNLQNKTTPFDINSTELDELKALGAIAQKGSDIDKLYNFLLNHEFNDYRLVFGLYGAINGFAVLSKLLTGKLLNENTYTLSVFKSIHELCMNIVNFNEQVKKEASKSSSNIDKPTSNYHALDIDKFLNMIMIKGIIKTKNKSALEWLKNQVKGSYDGSNISALIDRLEKIEDIKKGAGKGLKVIIKELKQRVESKGNAPKIEQGKLDVKF